jgi:type VI secretion system protein ImpI
VVTSDRGGVWGADEPAAGAARPAEPAPGDVWDAPAAAIPPAPPPAEDPQPRLPPAEMPASSPPPARPAPAPEPAASAGARASSDEFVRRFAAAAGIPPDLLAGQDPALVAQRLGELMRGIAGDMMQLLSARNEARRLARSAHQTTIQALDNNPLKFSPSPDEALRIMFGPRTESYLDAARAFAGGFADLKTHQVRTYSAMQAAVRMLAEDLDPASIEKTTPAEGGLSSMIGSRRARLWDAYVTIWEAKTKRHDDGLVDVFMLYFADCYNRALENDR